MLDPPRLNSPTRLFFHEGLRSKGGAAKRIYDGRRTQKNDIVSEDTLALVQQRITSAGASVAEAGGGRLRGGHWEPADPAR